MRSNQKGGTLRYAHAGSIQAQLRHAVLMRGAVLALLASGITITACHGAEQVASPPAPPPAPPLTPPQDNSEVDEADTPGAVSIAPTLITTATYDGSGELVHPDAVAFPEDWNGRKYWVSATPYPTGNPKYENPSIYQGYTSRRMTVPAGVKNPLALPGSGGYLSDPDMLYDPDRDQLRMYYRHVTGGSDDLYLMTSHNGVEWSAPQLVFTGDRYGLISPAIVRESASSWRMWSVSAMAQGCNSLISEVELNQRRSTDGITWSKPEPVILRVPGRVPWHLDVQYIPAKHEFWALIAAYPDGTSCSRTAIYFARSADGTDWTVAPNPLLGPYEFAPLNDLVYRSTFHYHEASDAVSVWFSGARAGDGGFHFAVASARYPYADLIRKVNGTPSTIMERERAGQVSVELQAARNAFERAFP
jgi:hypothetical protein